MMASGFTSSATVCPTTHQIVLTEVVRKLRDEIAEFATESTCFLSDTPLPGVEIQENLFCTVAPLDGTFDDRMPIGAADLGIVEVVFIQVSIWSRMQLDRLDHSARSLTDHTRGLLGLKKRVLQVLAGQQIFSDHPVKSIPLLVEPLKPIRAAHPSARKASDDFSSVSLVFRAAFNWNLASQ